MQNTAKIISKMQLNFPFGLVLWPWSNTRCKPLLEGSGLLLCWVAMYLLFLLAAEPGAQACCHVYLDQQQEMRSQIL